MTKQSIKKGDRVKFPIGDITYEVHDVRKQGGMKFVCIMSGYGYEWHSVQSLELVK